MATGVTSGIRFSLPRTVPPFSPSDFRQVRRCTGVRDRSVAESGRIRRPRHPTVSRSGTAGHRFFLPLRV